LQLEAPGHPRRSHCLKQNLGLAETSRRYGGTGVDLDVCGMAGGDGSDRRGDRGRPWGRNEEGEGIK
jgi:hypothetical protein